jgi:hypothetical protein
MLISPTRQIMEGEAQASSLQRSASLPSGTLGRKMRRRAGKMPRSRNLFQHALLCLVIRQFIRSAHAPPVVLSELEESPGR